MDGNSVEITSTMGIVEVRPFSSSLDCERVLDYFLTADSLFLRQMGVEPSLLPDRESWLRALVADLDRDDGEKKTCFVAWVYDGESIGHSNINNISLGNEAHIHLHMWKPDLRKGGLGTEFFKRSAQWFIGRFRLNRLICEPWAENAAPNRVLLKSGFKFTKRYRTVPGPIQFEQEVNRFELAKATEQLTASL